MNPAAAYRQLKKILEENTLPDIRFHDLRHTFATHALANGVDIKKLSGILGHTKASFGQMCGYAIGSVTGAKTIRSRTYAPTPRCPMNGGSISISSLLSAESSWTR